MFAEAEIIVNISNKLALPKEAVIQVDDDYFALVLNNEKTNEYHFKKVKLEIGLQTEDYIEIMNSENLKNKKLVVKGTYMLLNE